MYKVFFLCIFVLFFTACVNKDGLSTKYYDDCKEYYDALGVYHKKCDNDIFDKNEFMKVFSN